MKRQGFCFFSSIIDMWLCLRLGYPKIRCVLSLFSSFHCHLLVSKNTMFRQTKNLPSRKPTNSKIGQIWRNPFIQSVATMFLQLHLLIYDIPTTSPTVNLMNWSSFVTWGPKGKASFWCSPWIHRHGFHGQNSGKITSKPLEESWNCPAKVGVPGHRLALWQLWTMFRTFFSNS